MKEKIRQIYQTLEERNPGKLAWGVIMFVASGVLFVIYPWVNPYVGVQPYWIFPVGLICFSFGMSVWGFSDNVLSAASEYFTEIDSALTRQRTIIKAEFSEIDTTLNNHHIVIKSNLSDIDSALISQHLYPMSMPHYIIKSPVLQQR
jgi:quinol-cytochrome oxidoreductase complex cytochrome b subunit